MKDGEGDKPRGDCPCCSGLGIQFSKKEGLMVICPCCDGTGMKRKIKEGWH